MLFALATLSTSNAAAQQCASDDDCASDEACGPLEITWGWVNGIFTQIYTLGSCYDAYPECYNDDDCYEGQACGPLEFTVGTGPDDGLIYGPGDCYDLAELGDRCGADSDCASGGCVDSTCVVVCSPDTPCGAGEGMCETDKDCERGLSCTPPDTRFPDPFSAPSVCL